MGMASEITSKDKKIIELEAFIVKHCTPDTMNSKETLFYWSLHRKYLPGNYEMKGGGTDATQK